MGAARDRNRWRSLPARQSCLEILAARIDRAVEGGGQ